MDQMSAIFDSLDTRLSGPSIKEDLAVLLGNVCDSFGIDYYCLKTNLRMSNGDRKSLKVTNYPTPWLQRYSESGYAMVDPAAKHAIDHVGAASLEDLMEDVQQSSLKKRFESDARDIGLGSGITLPLRSPYLSGFLNFNGRNIDQDNNFVGSVSRFSDKISESLGQFCNSSGPSSGYHTLTLREKQVLFWAGYGKTAWETSLILGITQRTIIAHLTNSMKKLNCSNKFQMLSSISLLIDADPALDEFRIEL